ncbi:YwqJ-like deaminase [Nonomuraea solani]|uniref:YwqJ-like deaminase n=1 Tax=Nonomuraea solani TaxID=1144553 RepID=A0A1H6EWM7_9ACTN|nr:hypothetical protein [Nonomuraea solani]SEH01396.1 YwqJ-like deaminase [Nonomuraea solani]
MSMQPTGPTYGDQIPEEGFKAWSAKSRVVLQTYIKELRDLPSVREPYEAINTKMRNLENRVVDGMDEGAARDSLIEWLTLNDTKGAWKDFMTELARLEKILAQEKERKHRDEMLFNAHREARHLTGKYATGKGAAVGTVIAVIVHAKNGATWAGTSGGFSIAKKQHPLIKKLLSDVKKLEEWPVNACGEVAAMNEYLLSTPFTELSQIPADVLHFHAQTWSTDKSKWQARSACLNCDQWLATIKARRI